MPPPACHRLTREPIEPERLAAALRDPCRGAVATFAGTVRSPNRGREVVAIEYSAYEPMAERILAEIESEIAARHDGVRLGIVHRLGRLAPGTISIAVAAAGPHRRETLRACANGIDAVKERAPIWKREIYRDGAAWIEAGDAVAAAVRETE